MQINTAVIEKSKTRTPLKIIFKKLYPNRYTDQYLLNYYNHNKEKFNKPDIWNREKVKNFC